MRALISKESRTNSAEVYTKNTQACAEADKYVVRPLSRLFMRDVPKPGP